MAENNATLSSPFEGPVRLPPPLPITQRIGHGALTVYRTLRTNPLSFAGFVMVVALSVAAVVIYFDPGVLPYASLSLYNGPLNQGPTWAHPFGTDELGRDILANTLAALPIDLGIGVMIAGASLLFGGALGIVGGFYNRPRSLGSVASMVILRLTDLFLAFPSLILALAFTVALGRGLFQVVLAVFLTWWPYYVRLARGEVLAVKNQPYITAARAAGVRERRIVLRHVLRNILEPLVVYFTLDVGTVIVVFATVIYVTHALPYPATGPAEWGAMITFYQDFVNYLPWTVTFPGLAILVTVLSFSLLGDGLRDVLDPRSRLVITRLAPPGKTAPMLGGGLTDALGAATTAEPPGESPSEVPV